MMSSVISVCQIYCRTLCFLSFWLPASHFGCDAASCEVCLNRMLVLFLKQSYQLPGCGWLPLPSATILLVADQERGLIWGRMCKKLPWRNFPLWLNFNHWDLARVMRIGIWWCQAKSVLNCPFSDPRDHWRKMDSALCLPLHLVFPTLN